MDQGTSESAEMRDPFTGLPGRNLFDDRLRKALQLAARDGSLVAALYIDIDQFEPLARHLGAEAAGEVLRMFAERLADCLRSTDTVARPEPDDEATLSRIERDEFAIMLSGFEDELVPARVAEEALASLRRPVPLERATLFLTASIGIAVSPADGTEASTLVAASTSAWLARAGRGAIPIDTTEIGSTARQRTGVF